MTDTNTANTEAIGNSMDRVALLVYTELIRTINQDPGTQQQQHQ